MLTETCSRLKISIHSPHLYYQNSKKSYKIVNYYIDNKIQFFKKKSSQETVILHTINKNFDLKY